jgi:DNA polymerase-3 subunit gamma/tau
MSYTVIARKYRPQSFTEIIGQDHVSNTLLNSLKSGRLHHAILLTGPRGTGKTSTARVLAKAVRCANAKDFVPCNQCSDCQDIALSRAVDVTEIDGASNNGIEAIRELREGVGYMPSSGSKKVYIIDEVHMLSTSAFNALLKTLEEPPPHVLFIFATTDVHKLPATILSRVQRFDFKKIATKQIVKCLADVCKTEKVKFTEEALWVLAQQAGGSLRDSQSLLDQAISFTGQDLTEAAVRLTFGLTDHSLLGEIAQALLLKDHDKGLQFLSKLAESGVEPADFLTELLALLRDLVLLKTFGSKATALIDAPDSVVKERASWVGSTPVEEIHYIYDMLLKGHSDLAASPDPSGSLEVILLRILAAPKMMELIHVLQGGINATLAPTTQPAAQAAQVVKAPEQTAPQSFASPVRSIEEKIAQQSVPAGATANPATGFPWTQMVQKIKAVNPKLGAILEGCTLISEGGGELVIGVTAKMELFFEQLNSDSGRTKISNYIKTFYGKSLNVSLSKDTDGVRLSPAQEATQRIDRQKQELQAKVEEHPMVKQAKEHLKAEIRSMKEL